MKIVFAIFDKATNSFIAGPDGNIHESREAATEYCDLLNECEPGDFSIVRVKVY